MLVDAIRHYQTLSDKSTKIRRVPDIFLTSIRSTPLDNFPVYQHEKELCKNVTCGPSGIWHLGEDPDDSAEPLLTYILSPYHYIDTP
ncbi:hypothetical protein MPER_12199 [Moniliophthora perniciosa FA553]|nr:hypothetical protein MPER_12199 [Moniliophthora perniciosa FA553]